jgi:ADP-ribosyl-[dinitrogen reductase] hydrolase
MPVHWYYETDNILKDFGPAGVTRYEDAKHPHPEAFMVGMTYKPDVETVSHTSEPRAPDA